MTKFSDWLDGERGRATALAAALNITRPALTLVKQQKRPMPKGWFKTVVRTSNGFIKLRDLQPVLPEVNKPREGFNKHKLFCA